MIISAVFALATISFNAIAAPFTPSGTVDHHVTDSTGTIPTVLVSRVPEILAEDVKSSQGDGYKQEFVSTGNMETLCSYRKSIGLTKNTSPYFDDCHHIMEEAGKLKGYFDLYDLHPDREHALLTHKTCSLYYKSDKRHEEVR